jgi:thiamine-monophosphate kinase
MPLGEFQLIERYFQGVGPVRSDVALGVGDDCALLQPSPGLALAVTMDTLVAGVHFLPDVDPASLGHKALAVNLSDLAAMGAEPAWVTLAITLPRADEAWLASFAAGFHGLARQHGVQLVGGDTTRGPLSVTVQAMGYVPQGDALRRAGAKAGDGIYVTGELGSAGLALKALRGDEGPASPSDLERLFRPQPRVTEGLALRGLAHACIDISDGLAADLGHILEQSGVGASIDWEALPLSESVRRYVEQSGDWRLPLCAGDDYELCFTLPAERESELAARFGALDCRLSRIGRIEVEPGLRMLHGRRVESLPAAGYQHF